MLLGTLAAMLVSGAKAGFGGSMGLLSVPLMIVACGDAAFALGIMLPLLMVCDVVAVISWWGKWNLRAAGLLLPGAVVGIAVGTAGLWGFQQLGSEGQKQIADAWLRIGIGAIALGFVALQGIRALRSRPITVTPTPLHGSLVGSVAGLTSSLSHGAGPVVTMYMLPQQMPKGMYVATTVFYLWLNNLLKLPGYVALGLVSGGSLHASAVLVPGVLVGALLGLTLHKKVPQKQFNMVVYTLLALAGVHLITNGLRML
ncbi:MAG: sulfite exporter TauE/SafE family protein [Planctomycetota bacterium]